MATFSVILAAAGKSSRFRDKNYKKPFAPLADRAVWLHSAEKFLNRDDVKQLILVISPRTARRLTRSSAANVAILGIRGGAGRRRAGGLDRQRAGARARRCRFRGGARRRPPVPGDRVDGPGLRGGGESGRGDPGHPGRRHAQTSRPRQTRSSRPFPGPVCGRRRRRRSFAASCCWTPMRGAAARRRPMTPNWCSGSGHPVTVVPGSPINLKITTREDLQLGRAGAEGPPQTQDPRPRASRLPTTICGGNLPSSGATDSADDHLTALPIYEELTWRGLIHQVTDEPHLANGRLPSPTRSTPASTRRPTACMSGTFCR